MQLFWECKGSGFLGAIITRVAHGLRPFEMQPAMSSSHISSSTNLWYLSGMGYSLCAIGGPVVWTFSLYRLVLPISVEDFDMME